MTAAERLIVALDGDIIEMQLLARRLSSETAVRFFKLGPSSLLQPGFHATVDVILDNCNADLFLDLTLYNTRDTVQVAIKAAFDLGARFVTVHATPSVMEAAMRAKPAGDRCKVLAVGPTTDQGNNAISPYAHETMVCALKICDGVVCHPKLAFHARRDKKISVCPGIRPLPPPFTIRPDCLTDGGHSYPQTPTVALKSGADYLVVGRPIWRADDPVAAARVIIAEMEEAI